MSALLQQAVLIIDTVLVGGLGEDALAAMGIATAIAGLIIGVLFAFANGTQILIANAFGAANTRALTSGFWSGHIVGGFVAAIGVVIILLVHGPLVDQFAKTTDVANLASTYLVIFTLAIIGISICQNISVFFYATGKPRLPFYSKLIELPFNALLSYALIYGYAGLPKLGLAGAAIGSVVAVSFRAIFLCWCLFLSDSGWLVRSGWLRSGVVASVAHHLKNALPIAGTFISMNLSFTVCMMLYSQLEVFEFAALTILVLWVRSCGQLVTAWSQATGIVVGQLLGQKRLALLDPFVSSAWRVAIILGVVIAAIYASMPLIFTWVYPNLQAQTLGVIAALLPVLIVLPLVRSSNTVCGNVLRAAGQSAYAFKVHVLAQWLFTVPMTALFVLVWDMSVVWVFAIYIVEELIKALPFHMRMRSGEWKIPTVVPV